jgi:type I restriction enzyme S subunit
VLLNFAVPIPPLDEQKEIVKLTNLLFAEMGTIKERHLKSTQYVNRVGDALLVRAFRGELATQDLNDEPASLLLERIKSSASTPKQKKTPPSKRKAAKEPESLSA